MSSPCLVSNWKMCSTPATRILKNTAAAEEPNCMMSLSSALCKYSIGAGRKKWIPRVLIPSTMRPGNSPIGSSIRLTGKNADPPYGNARIMRSKLCRASSFGLEASALCRVCTSTAQSSRGRCCRIARGMKRGRAAASEETPSWIRHKSDFRGGKQNVVQRNRRDILVFAAIDDDRRNIKLATFRHAMHDTKNEEHTGWTGGLKHGIEGFVFVAETLLRAAPIVHRGEMRARRVTLEAAQSAGHDDQ